MPKWSVSIPALYGVLPWPALAGEMVPAALSEPGLVEAARISPGDTAWMITATALVLLMTLPGLALFYAGMVRKKNALSVLAQCVAITALVSVLWMLVGYSLALTPFNDYLGGLGRVALTGLGYFKETGRLSVSHIAPTIPESLFVMFQLSFAVITPALIVGTFAERMKFSAMLWFMACWSLLVYVPVAHWVWEPGGWLAKLGVLDFAGGMVVHVNAGIAAIVAALMLRERLGYGEEPMPPHNLALTFIGASLLWVGWFGFNAGSALAADGRAGLAMLVTHMATAMGTLAWMAMEWLWRGRPSLLGLVSGALAGLVAVTPAAGFVTPPAALLIGGCAGIFCYLAATKLKIALGYDDSLDVFGIHFIGGVVGTLLTGVLADPVLGGATGKPLVQFIGVAATSLYGLVVSYLILKSLDLTLGLRVTEEEERDGLDLSLHGEQVE